MNYENILESLKLDANDIAYKLKKYRNEENYDKYIPAIKCLKDILFLINTYENKAIEINGNISIDDLEDFVKKAKDCACILGRVLCHPIDGAVLLTKYGITFTDKQLEDIKKYTQMNDVQEAQKIILKELEDEFN